MRIKKSCRGVAMSVPIDLCSDHVLSPRDVTFWWRACTGPYEGENLAFIAHILLGPGEAAKNKLASLADTRILADRFEAALFSILSREDLDRDEISLAENYYQVLEIHGFVNRIHNPIDKSEDSPRPFLTRLANYLEINDNDFESVYYFQAVSSDE
jgi:hypothetical protein